MKIDSEVAQLDVGTGEIPLVQIQEPQSILVATTCHKAGYEMYGLRFVQGWQHWPQDAVLHWYTEGFSPPPMPRTLMIPTSKVEGLESFKQRFAHYTPASWQFDVVRYCNKVFAAADAFYDFKGIGVWLDADCVTFKDLSSEYLKSLIPKGHYMSLFQRTGFHTETGFWIMDCAHEQHQAFLATWIEWYLSNQFKDLPEWHDCYTLDATVRMFEKKGLIKTHNLSGEFHKDMHPLCKVELGKYIDHCKGKRKINGRSPENLNRNDDQA
jgi:hypothetical protein